MWQLSLFWRGVLLVLILFTGSLVPFQSSIVTADVIQSNPLSTAFAPTNIVSPTVTNSPSNINPQSSNPAASIDIASGNNQSTPVSLTFPTGLRVQLKDSDG